jgi:hypothetical protein
MPPVRRGSSWGPLPTSILRVHAGNRRRESGCGSDSKNLFRSFGTLQGDAIDSSDPNTHSGGDPLPPDSLHSKRGNPPHIHDLAADAPKRLLFARAFRNPAFNDPRAFQFRDGARDREDHLAGGRAGVELPGEGNELDTLGLLLFMARHSGEVWFDLVDMAPIMTGSLYQRGARWFNSSNTVSGTSFHESASGSDGQIARARWTSWRAYAQALICRTSPKGSSCCKKSKSRTLRVSTEQPCFLADIVTCGSVPRSR